MAENPLFADTVTLYHADPAAHTVTRRVLRGVYLQTGMRQKPDVKGTKSGTSFLLVIPAAVWDGAALNPGDRLCRGEGAALSWQQFAAFVPGKAQTAVVEYILLLMHRGRLHHIEVGAWWQGTGTGAHSLTR